MKKILAFAGSNHSKSINQQLVAYTAGLISDIEVEVLDISKWNIPIYSIDMDPDQTPIEITQLIDLINSSDGFIISSPEHNGGTSAFFKNIIDWLSRRSKNAFDSKPMLLMSTSPGKTGGEKNRLYLENMLPYLGADIAETFSLASYYENIHEGKMEEALFDELNKKLTAFANKVLI